MALFIALPERLQRRIEFEPNSGCWLWTGSDNGKGYCQVRWNGPKVSVHILVYELLVGPVSDGLELDHLCRARRCCNPSHLEPVPHTVNILRGESPSALCAEKTHCPKGHPYDYFEGGRRCYQCRLAQNNAARARRIAIA